MDQLATRYGLVSVPDSESDLIGRHLARFGEWGWLEVSFVASLLGPAARVADIGAFVGTFGLGLDRLKELQSICFVEANPDVFPLLHDNTQRLCRAKSVARPVLIAPEGHAISTGVRSKNNFGSSSFAPAGGDATDQEIVPAPAAALTLGELILQEGPFDLIKLDVEGMELSILASAASLLAQSGAALWLECNETPESLDLAAWLRAAGFGVWYFAFPSFNPANFGGSDDPIFTFAFESALFATKSQELPSHGAVPPGCMLHRIFSTDELKAAMWKTPRFGPREWHGLSRDEIVALAGHVMMGDTVSTYLSGPRGHWELPIRRLERRIKEQSAEIAALRAQVKTLSEGSTP